MEQVLKASSQVLKKPVTFTCYFLFNHPTPPNLGKKKAILSKKNKNLQEHKDTTTGPLLEGFTCFGFLE